MPRITLSGRNDQNIARTVYWDGREIGTVTPARDWCWQAVDKHGRVHGTRWLTDWFAADALVLALGLTRAP